MPALMVEVSRTVKKEDGKHGQDSQPVDVVPSFKPQHFPSCGQYDKLIAVYNQQKGESMDFKKLKKRLARLDTACICDATKSFQVVDPGIRPVFDGIKMIGIARTVHCRSDFLSVIKALQEAQEDEVLV